MSTNLLYGIPILFFALFAILFLLATGVIVAVIVLLLKRKKKNDSAPQLTVNATVATKRTRVSGGGKNDLGMGASTWYYVTFQVESGDRMELSVTGADYGLLAEGDKGRLTFQGTRFIRFERDLY